MPLPRRSFLRSGTALIALPFFESLGFRPFVANAAPTPVKRFLFLGFGWGVTKETWFPDVKQTGRDYTLPDGLKPLERHRSNFSIVQNLSNKFTNEAHWGSTFWLTGANRYAEPGQSFSNSISADQVAAEHLGKETRFSSLQLSCERGDESGHGPGLSLAWNRRGKPVAAFNNPVKAFNALFSDGNVPLAQRQSLLRQRRSILDTVLEDAGQVARSLNKEDTDKLSEYLQSIRDIEVRLSKEEQWLERPKPNPLGLVDDPAESLAGFEEIKLMYSLLAAALRTDSTRVASYRQPVDTLLKSLKISFSGHNLSHYSPGPRMDSSQLRDRKQSELLAHLLDLLQAAKESDGATLLDRTTVVYGSNIQSIHYLTNCPTLIAGGGSGIRLGEHLVVQDPKTPLCNLWLTLLKGSGVPVENHGDSTGTLPEILA
ncbi:MAG: hypothetical protein RIS92_1521 [Verrucomicrobiota bacterium]|jgi:hypothetical protein